MATTDQDDSRSDAQEISEQDVQTDVGKNVEKVDGRGLVTGRAAYTDDVPTENALEIAVLRSPHAHAEVMNIDAAAASQMEGVTAVLTPADVPDRRFTRMGLPRPAAAPYDELILDEKIRYYGQPVAAVAARTADEAKAAVDSISVEYDVREALVDPDRAMAADAPTIHDQDDYVNPQENANPDRNIVAQIEHSRGDVQAGFEAADHVVENEYQTQVVQHAPMEMNTTIAWIDDRERLVLRTSTQIPHLCRNIIAEAFGLDQTDVRVIKPRVGGGFGVKQDVVPSQLLAAALALETGERVRIENGRREDLHTAQTRHSVKFRVKTGVTADGAITANFLDIVSNSGAYGGHGNVTLSAGAHEALSLYPRAAVGFSGTSVYTNLPMGGAFRGYGSPQSVFALESNVSEAARTIGMDPMVLRLKNCARSGDEAFEPEVLATEGPINSCELQECIQRGAERIEWDDPPTAEEDTPWVYGQGMSLAVHKSGVPRDELARANITLERDGTATLSVGVGDAGQAADTTMAQIAASALGVPTEDIHVHTDDTDTTPFDNGAYASSQTYVSGQAVEHAVDNLKAGIFDVAARLLPGDPESFELEGGAVHDGHEAVSLGDVADEAAAGHHGPKTQLQGAGEHYTGKSPHPFAAQLARVKVNAETGDYEVVNLVNAVDCGEVIHPENARGQVIGGAVMGLGMAISEEIAFDEDAVPQLEGLKDYDVLKSGDMPERVSAIFVESHEDTGPFGAKSVGEITAIGPPAAVANAVRDAVGVRVESLPVSADDVAHRLGD